MNEFNQLLYQKIYDYLIENIDSGNYSDGERVPSEKELSDKFKVSRITSKKALRMLAENGYIKRMPGKGSFVISDAERSEFRNEANTATKPKGRLIGLITSDFSESYGISLLSGIEKEASENACFIVPRRTFGRQDLEEKAIDDLLEMGVCGLIIMPVYGENYNPKILRLVLDGFPVVLVDRHLRGIATPFVGTDNVSAAKKATDYLLDLGHRSISFISPPPTNTSAIEERIEGFVKSHAEHGVAIDESIWLTSLTSTISGSNKEECLPIDMKKIEQLIINNTHITCIFAAEYNIGLIALDVVRSLDMSVPKDISILCFDGPSSHVDKYFFTHIRQRENEMGTTAVKLLLEQMNGKGGNDKVFLDADLIIGASTMRQEGRFSLSHFDS